MKVLKDDEELIIDGKRLREYRAVCRKEGALKELELISDFIKKYQSSFDEVINVKSFILGRIKILERFGKK